MFTSLADLTPYQVVHAGCVCWSVNLSKSNKEQRNRSASISLTLRASELHIGVCFFFVGMCVYTHLHELVMLLWIKVSLQVYLTEGELLVAGQLLKLLQLFHDLIAF